MSKNKKKIIIWLYLFLYIKFIYGSNLIEYILKDYDSRVRPYADCYCPVMINMTIVLAILTELNENQQVAAFVISHIQRWHDPQLQWDPSKFNNQTQVIIPHKNIWVPKMFVYNSKDTKMMLDDSRFDARISYNGDIKINIPQYVNCICRLHIEAFPFDTQYCAIALASPLLTIDEMNVTVLQPPELSYFTGNAEWELKDVKVKRIEFPEEDEWRVEVQYIFQLKRRPMFYLTVIVAPNFLISFLSIIGIFSPGSNDGERNEKVSLGLGCLLAMTVLLGIVAGAMPKSNSIPLLGYYILSVIIICATAVAVSMSFLAINKRFIDNNKMPTDFAYRLMGVKPRTIESRRHYSRISSSFMFTTTDRVRRNKIFTEFETPGIEAIYNELSSIIRYHQSLIFQVKKKEAKKAIEHEWNRIFVRVDYCCLLFFQLLNIFTLGFFLQFAWSSPPSQPDQLI